MTTIFVYGSLLGGMPLSDALAESAFMGHGKIDGALYDVGHYPGLQEGDGFVYGELYAVERDTLAALDRIEGYFPNDPDHSLYLRRQIAVRPFDGGSTIQAYSYFYCGQMAQSITCGDYRRYRLEQSNGPQWYIAYGSNMSSARLRERLGRDAVRAVETGYLQGYALRFNKRAHAGGVYANLAYQGAGHRCPFAAYLLSRDALDELDRWEGEPDHYVRLGLPFPQTDGLGLGHVYIAAPDRVIPDQTPDPEYRQHLAHGYEEHGFDADALPGAAFR